MNDLSFIAIAASVALTTAGVIGLVDKDKKDVPLPRPKPAMEQAQQDIPPQSTMSSEELRLRRIEVRGQEVTDKVKTLDSKIQLLEQYLNNPQSVATDERQTGK